MDNLIYEGKAKMIFTTEDPDQVRMYFKDDATAGNRAKEAVFKGKGALNCSITHKLFNRLTVNTHHIKTIGDREMIVKKLNIIPLEVIVRNIAAGTFCKRYGVDVGTPLRKTIIEFCIKDDALNDPLINDDAIIALGISDSITLSILKEQSLRINTELTNIFAVHNLRLVDFKLEFGMTKDGSIVLADEICPDTMRLWNNKNESFDKDLFRNNTGDLLAGYETVDRLLQ